MHSTLTQSLDILVGTGTKSEPLGHLIGKDAVLSLKVLASNLAPILQGGFECRLGAGVSQVDLQQCVVPSKNELALLREFMTMAISHCEEVARPGWLRLQNFLTEWSNLSNILHDNIPEIWLEFDIDNPSIFLPLPAIFFGLPQKVLPAIEIYEIVAKSINLLLGELPWRGWQDNLYNCFANCPHEAFVSHIGVMLSRNAPALRVNVKRLQPDSLIPYLQQIGWQEDINEVEELMEELFGLVDRITVCLDVGNKIYSKIGLECILLHQPADESRWAIFLDYLVEQGLCEPKKREALLNWCGQTNPINTYAPWPDDLIVASLLRTREHFTVFDRRLSHIKIVWQPQKLLEAKAYLWFQHQWLCGESKN